MFRVLCLACVFCVGHSAASQEAQQGKSPTIGDQIEEQDQDKLEEEATKLNRRVIELYKEGDFAAAVGIGRKVLEIRKKILGKEHPDYASSLNNLASLCFAMGDYDAARPLFIEAKTIREKVLGKDHPDYATSLNNLAMLYSTTSDYDAAMPLYIEAKAIDEKVLGKDHPDYATSLNNLAMLYSRMGDYDAAKPLYIEAKAIDEKVLGNDHPDYATDLINLAGLYQSMGDYDAAKPLYIEAKTILEKIVGKDHPSYATSLNNLALLYEEMGDYDAAKPLFIEANAIQGKVLGKDHPSYAASLNNLASLYLAVGDYDAAKPLYIEAKTIQEKILGKDHPDYASSLNNLALLYAEMGDYDAAKPLYIEAKAIREKVLGKDHPDYATSLNNLAGLHKAVGDYDAAKPLLTEAKAILEEILGRDHLSYATNLNNLAYLYEKMGNYDAAKPLYGNAIQVTLAHLDKTSFVQSERQQMLMIQSVRQPLDNYIVCCLKGRLNPTQAVSQLTTWKGSVLVRNRNIRLAASDPLIADDFRRLQSIASQVGTLTRSIPQSNRTDLLRERVDTLYKEQRSLEATLMKRSASFRHARKQVKFDEICQAIPENAVLVDFLQYNAAEGPSILASIIHRDRDPVLVGLGSAKSAGKSIEDWRESFGMSAKSKAAGIRLRKQIWAPLLDEIEDSKLVLICADGILGRLPFAALPGRASDTYLIEDHRLAMIPVPQLLPDLLNKQGSKELSRELLLLGDVDYDTQPGAPKKKRQRRSVSADFKFDALEGAAGEIATIAKTYRDAFEFDGDDIMTLDGSNASEAQFRQFAPKFHNLHLATHGFFVSAEKKSSAMDLKRGTSNFNRPTFDGPYPRVVDPYLQSGLALAGANREPQPDQDDGILTAREIAYLPLGGVDTVVLSACDTVLGEVASGEGLISIQRAFQVAGARTTVASLWKVDDLVTRILMERFYKNLWENEMSHLDALREAQLYILRNPRSIRGVAGVVSLTRTSPRYWAAFQLSGDWR